MIIKRGDIFYANLNPVIGSEQGGVRPVLIVQNDTGNYHSPTVIVVPITSSNVKSKLPTHQNLAELEFLLNGSITLAEQIRTIDKSRLISYIGSLDTERMKKIDNTLKTSIGLSLVDGG